MLKYFICLMLLLGSNANAASLSEELKGLEVLELNYGANNLKISGHDILITKGYFASEAAGGGDGYSVFLKRENDWQLARVDDGKTSKEVVIWSTEHTKEDAVKSVVFLTGVKSGSNSSKNLYVLTAQRKYKHTPQEAASVEFVLYELQEDRGFGIWYVKKVAESTSVGNYKNSDDAIYKEFDGQR